MAIPHETEIKCQLLRLLSEAPKGTMHCSKVYDLLALLFPELTPEETDRRYQNSVSKWANAVQWARWRCVLEGLLERPRTRWDFGYWKVTESGRRLICPTDVRQERTYV